MTNFSKAELAAAVAEKTGVTKAAAGSVIEAIAETIKAQAEMGKTVSIPGFGKFEVKHRSARTGRNPATGEPLEIAASSKLGFKPSKVGS